MNGRKKCGNSQKNIEKAKEDRKDPYIAILEFRNTPRNKNLGSPVQRLMGLRTKTLIPTNKKLLQPQVINPSKVQSELQTEKNKQKGYYDRNAKTLKPILPGQNIRYHTDCGWNEATVTKLNEAPRSYEIQTPDGQELRRDRQQLMTTNEKQLSNEPQHCNDDDNIADTFSNNCDKEQSKIIPPAQKIIADDSTNSKYVTRSGRTITTPKRYNG